MLQNLSKQVRECLERAEACGRRATIEPDPQIARDFLEIERRWRSLARSYELSERLDRFSAHNKKLRDEADDILDRMARSGMREGE
jgi:hypothetical protein